MVRGQAASTRSECRGERAFNINCKHGLFHLMYFQNWLWSQGTKCVVCEKKKATPTWSPQKRSRPALTYHELLSNFISPLDLDNSARICSAWRIALTSSKSKQSAETFVDASKHFQFFCFEIWERNRNITKKTIANFSEWVRSAQKPVFSSAVNWYMFYNFPSTFKLQN